MAYCWRRSCCSHCSPPTPRSPFRRRCRGMGRGRSPSATRLAHGLASARRLLRGRSPPRRVAHGQAQSHVGEGASLQGRRSVRERLHRRSHRPSHQGHVYKSDSTSYKTGRGQVLSLLMDGIFYHLVDGHSDSLAANKVLATLIKGCSHVPKLSETIGAFASYASDGRSDKGIVEVLRALSTQPPRPECESADSSLQPGPTYDMFT